MLDRYSILRDERSWKLPRDYDPPKPLRSKQIARLGDRLDEFESAPAWPPAQYDAQVEYLTATRDRAWFEIKKFQNLKRVPSQRDGQRLRAELVNALCRLDEAKTAREFCDARAAVLLADSKFQIAERKHLEARRQARADERAGKNIVTLRGMTFRRGRR